MRSITKDTSNFINYEDISAICLKTTILSLFRLTWMTSWTRKTKFNFIMKWISTRQWFCRGRNRKWKKWGSWAKRQQQKNWKNWENWTDGTHFQALSCQILRIATEKKVSRNWFRNLRRASCRNLSRGMNSSWRPPTFWKIWRNKWRNSQTKS